MSSKYTTLFLEVTDTQIWCLVSTIQLILSPSFLLQPSEENKFPFLSPACHEISFELMAVIESFPHWILKPFLLWRWEASQIWDTPQRRVEFYYEKFLHLQDSKKRYLPYNLGLKMTYVQTYQFCISYFIIHISAIWT